MMVDRKIAPFEAAIIRYPDDPIIRRSEVREHMKALAIRDRNIIGEGVFRHHNGLCNPSGKILLVKPANRVGRSLNERHQNRPSSIFHSTHPAVVATSTHIGDLL